MISYSRAQLSDDALSRQLGASFARERKSTAHLLADIAEFDGRKLYLPAGYPSMFAYCTAKFGLSEQAALKRIRAARTARQYPMVFAAIEEGRLNLSIVVLVRPYLSQCTNPEALLADAESKSRSQVEQLLAERFPQSDVPTRLRAIPEAVQPDPSELQMTLRTDPPTQNAPTAESAAPTGRTAPAERIAPTQSAAPTESIAHTENASPKTDLLLPELTRRPEETSQLSPGTVVKSVSPIARFVAVPSTPSPRVTPLSPKRFALQVTLSQSAYDKLRKAQALLSHQIPRGDIALVLEKALELAIAQLEKQRFATTRKPRKASHRASHPRTIPAHVRRAVRERDGEQCTFVSSDGRRCTERSFLEFDHALEVARGGKATVEGIRLRCRAHNQYTAERTFGAEFMKRKRRARTG